MFSKQNKSEFGSKVKAIKDQLLDDPLFYGFMLVLVIVIAMLITSIVSGFSAEQKTQQIQDNLPAIIQQAEDNGDEFVVIDEHPHGYPGYSRIVLDVKTGVQYIYTGKTGSTPILDSDGRPLLNETWKEMHNIDK